MQLRANFVLEEHTGDFSQFLKLKCFVRTTSGEESLHVPHEELRFDSLRRGKQVSGVDVVNHFCVVFWAKKDAGLVAENNGQRALA